MEKMTNVKALTYVVENCELPADVAEKIGNILTTYTKKSATSADRKPTAEQVKNTETGVAVAKWMAEQGSTQFTVTEILKTCPACAEIPSTQKLTPILTRLVGENAIAKTTTKGRAYYHAMA